MGDETAYGNPHQTNPIPSSFEDLTEMKNMSGDTVRDPATETPSIAASFTLELGKQVLVLRHSLSGWKEILLATKAILLWEKQWHPTAIIGCTSILFMFVWLADPSILTMLSMIGLTVTLADYLVPLIGPSIFKKDSWTNTEEVAYEDLCRSMVVYKTKMMVSFYYYVLMRTTRPKMYYSCTITILVLLTWLGMSVNNLFLMYIVVTTLLLYPGLEHQGLLRKYSSKVSGKIGEYKAQAQLSFNGFHAKKE